MAKEKLKKVLGAYTMFWRIIFHLFIWGFIMYIPTVLAIGFIETIDNVVIKFFMSISAYFIITFVVWIAATKSVLNKNNYVDNNCINNIIKKLIILVVCFSLIIFFMDFIPIMDDISEGNLFAYDLLFSYSMTLIFTIISNIIIIVIPLKKVLIKKSA